MSTILNRHFNGTKSKGFGFNWYRQTLKWSGESEIRRMKASTQKNVGLTTAVVLFVVGIYMAVLSPHFSVYGYPLTILCLIYIFALFRKKLRTAQVVYQLFRFGGLIILTLITLAAIAAYTKKFDNVQGAVEGAILLCVWLLYGCVVLLWRIGLKGLQQVIGNETNQKTNKNNK